MRFNLKKPCADCPFRNDKPERKGWLGENRAEEIYHALTDNKTFACHKTVTYEGDEPVKNGEQFCAGALIMMEKEGTAIQSNAIRMAERLRLYQHKEMDMTSPVFETGEDFIEWHSEKVES